MSVASSPRSVAVIGGGPAGLIAAETLALAGHKVTVYEQMPTVGRKFLVAGRGGLNLTHTQALEPFLDRYRGARPALEPAIRAFDPAALRDWCAQLGETTTVGSSGRVFPASFRATALLRAWLVRLEDLGVEIATRHRWTGWVPNSSRLTFDNAADELIEVSADAVIIALGGASWPRTGSNGDWVSTFTDAGVTVTPLVPSNCGFDVEWSDYFAERFAGTPLKNVLISFGEVSVRGEAMITTTGIEGGAIYELSALLRSSLARKLSTELVIDLRPDVAEDELARRFSRPRPKESVANMLRRAGGLTPVGIALMREMVGEQFPASSIERARIAKHVAVKLVAPRPIERAISSAGGVRFDQLDERLMLKSRPGVFIAGEMLDWEAPTGGYLLQATFSTGVFAANGAIDWLSNK